MSKYVILFSENINVCYILRLPSVYLLFDIFKVAMQYSPNISKYPQFSDETPNIILKFLSVSYSLNSSMSNCLNLIVSILHSLTNYLCLLSMYLRI